MRDWNEYPQLAVGQRWCDREGHGLIYVIVRFSRMYVRMRSERSKTLQSFHPNVILERFDLVEEP